MKVSKSLLSALAVGMLVSACNSVDFKKTKGGVPYKIFPSKSGDKIVQGNIVKYDFTIKVKDSVVNTTYGNFPKYDQVAPSPGGYDIGGAIMEVLTKAKKGDSIVMVMSMDSFIAKDPTILQQTPFRKGDQLTATFMIHEVFRTQDLAQADFMKQRKASAGQMEAKRMQQFKSNPQVQAQLQKDSKTIEDYLAANHIQAQKTEWGAYVQVLDPGQGPKPAVGQFASVRYKGTNMTGEEFDSNMKPGAPPYPFQIGTGGAIIGFEEGVKALGKGGKAKVFVPSSLGYGAQGAGGKITPNENLVFDLEVVDISDNPPAQQLPPNIDTTQARK